MTVCPAKTQINLGIHPVWSESSLCAQWVAKDRRFLHADSKNFDQTGWMARLIWVYTLGAHSLCWFCHVTAHLVVSHFTVWKPIIIQLLCFDISKSSSLILELLPEQRIKGAATWQNQQNECAPSKDSDQPGHPPSLIRVFAVCMKKAWVLSYPLSAQRRLWSDWGDAQADLSLRWAHSHFGCHVVAYMTCYLMHLAISWFLVYMIFCQMHNIYWHIF